MTNMNLHQPTFPSGSWNRMYPHRQICLQMTKMASNKKCINHLCMHSMETSICLLSWKGRSPPTTINVLPVTTKLLGNPFCQSNFKQVVGQPTYFLGVKYSIAKPQLFPCSKEMGTPSHFIQNSRPILTFIFHILQYLMLESFINSSSGPHPWHGKKWHM